jgi:predicted ATPase
VIQSLHLKRFKSFEDATLTLGPLTVLIGANATGKSNIRDAFLFLHGIGMGYSLAEILGEKWVGGERIWTGIRGGVREATYWGADSFELEVDMRLPPEERVVPPVEYKIAVSVAGSLDNAPRLADESLHYPRVFGKRIDAPGKTEFRVVGPSNGKETDLDVSFLPQRRAREKGARTYAPGSPILSQVAEGEERNDREARAMSRFVVAELKSFRFLDLSPTQMRIPPLPGQTTLGDRGENLSSVLAAICADPKRKHVLLEWLRKLTPMDVDDLVFDRDAAGRLLVKLVEGEGRSVSALSASDGTLRFLGFLAALFGPDPASFYFIEELENGIHPTRLSLLVDLIEHQAKRRGIQIVATSHSSQLLQFLSDESLEHTSVVYRLPDRPDARIKPILEIPNARRVIKEQPIWVPHASSWFEDMLDFEDAGAEPAAEKQPVS